MTNKKQLVDQFNENDTNTSYDWKTVHHNLKHILTDPNNFSDFLKCDVSYQPAWFDNHKNIGPFSQLLQIHQQGIAQRKNNEQHISPSELIFTINAGRGSGHTAFAFNLMERSHSVLIVHNRHARHRAIHDIRISQISDHVYDKRELTQPPLMRLNHHVDFIIVDDYSMFNNEELRGFHEFLASSRSYISRGIVLLG